MTKKKIDANILVDNMMDFIQKKQVPEEFDSFEEKDLVKEREQLELDGIYEDNKSKEANRLLRAEYANKVYKYLVWYSIICAILLICSGLFPQFKLSDSVLITLVGSTGVSAIGLVGFVVNGLFKNH